MKFEFQFLKYSFIFAILPYHFTFSLKNWLNISVEKQTVDKKTGRYSIDTLYLLYLGGFKNSKTNILVLKLLGKRFQWDLIK